MLLKPLNLLILDEPTNHLDLHSKDILLGALSKFKGTIIFVSHDRYFMEALSTKTLELSAGTPAKARLFYGNYAYYLERKSSEQTDENRIEIPKAREEQKSSGEKRAIDKQKQTHTRRLERQEAEILKTLEELESKKSSLETELALPEVYSDREKAIGIKHRLDECTTAIEEKSRQWEGIAEQLANNKE
jgi:ATP-binding cassette subfamily F protein 3